MTGINELCRFITGISEKNSHLQNKHANVNENLLDSWTTNSETEIMNVRIDILSICFLRLPFPSLSYLAFRREKSDNNLVFLSR